MDLDPRLLRYFVAVMEEISFKPAAATVHGTPSGGTPRGGPWAYDHTASATIRPAGPASGRWSTMAQPVSASQPCISTAL
jgi:hypothetical protein